MAEIRAIGRVLLWPGSSLWIGRSSGTTSPHIHHAIQISIALDGSFELMTPVADWTEYQGAIVPSHLHHALRVSNPVLATIFVEPESPEGHALLDRFGTNAIKAIPSDLRDAAARVLAHAYEHVREDDRLISAAREGIDILTSGAARHVAVDDRILRAIDLIRDRLRGSISQDEIAGAVFLSPSRFRHLFVEQTGMPFRPYVLWLRLQRALESMVAGESLTSAAVAAGFSDTAHMTRTFRRMFGLTPGLLEREKEPTGRISRYVQGE